MSILADSILEILEEKGQVAVIGSHPGFREKVIANTIQAAAKAYGVIAVIDWYGAYNVDAIQTVEPTLPYSSTAKYLPLAVSSMHGLYRIGALVEGLVYEAVQSSDSFHQTVSRLEALSTRRDWARTILSKIALLKDYFVENIILPTKFRVNLFKAPVLIRRPLSQLWVALVSETVAAQKGLLVVSEAGRAIKRGWWVWSLIDDARVRGARVLLADSRLLRAYLQNTLVFTDYRPEEALAAQRYRLQILTKKWVKGKALLVKDPEEPRLLNIE
ncbi:MAG: hypothetical protein QXL98_04060 [Thermofilaceae archaeon]